MEEVVLALGSGRDQSVVDDINIHVIGRPFFSANLLDYFFHGFFRGSGRGLHIPIFLRGGDLLAWRSLGDMVGLVK